MKTRLIFETVKNHLLSQMRESRDSRGICLYRGDHGLACAIGCLITTQYDPYLETLLVGSPEVLAAIDRKYCVSSSEMDVTFLTKLQIIHDNRPPDMWAKKLEEFEQKYLD
jgi:hypothetical protein